MGLPKKVLREASLLRQLNEASTKMFSSIFTGRSKASWSSVPLPGKKTKKWW